MTTQLLLSSQLDKDIIVLLSVCNIPRAEKSLWLDVLEDMTDEEKHTLIANLNQQVGLELSFEKNTSENFLQELDNLPI